MGTDYSPLWISFKTVLAATLITFVFGIFVAWIINNYSGRFKYLIDVLLTLPMVLPPTVLGFFLLIIFGKNGPIGGILDFLNTSVIFSWYATVIAAVFVSFPLMYKTTKGAFEQIDKNIINAARTLGVSELRIFFNIIIPIAWPGITAGTILAFTRALGEFGATMMIAGNIPGKTQTMPVAIFFAVEGGDMRQALIWVVLICSISLIVMMLVNYWNKYQKINSYY